MQIFPGFPAGGNICIYLQYIHFFFTGLEHSQIAGFRYSFWLGSASVA